MSRRVGQDGRQRGREAPCGFPSPGDAARPACRSRRDHTDPASAPGLRPRGPAGRHPGRRTGGPLRCAPVSPAALRVPGIVTILGVRLLAEIGDRPVERFGSGRSLAAYAGVAPVTWASGQTVSPIESCWSDLAERLERKRTRNTPARAGRTTTRTRTASAAPKHPRAYGEQRHERRSSSLARGTSPRVRVAVAVEKDHDVGVGNIPGRAGSRLDDLGV
ncbi:transposase [Streptomyces niveus]|uniref:transposase n=1 Tax=Streptomyces niveus TaxID=193462 RepID=UPI0035D619CA